MNNISIVGRMVYTPELRATPSGKPVTSFCVAVKRPMTKDKTDFIDCVAWEKTAELVTRHFTKGEPIGLTGHIETRTYENVDGKNIKVTELVCSQVIFLPKSAADAENKGNELAVNEDFEEIGYYEGLPF